MREIKCLLVCFLLLNSMSIMAYEIIAHRGSSGHAPENTLAAIKTAQDQGVDYIEIDVHMTRDNEVVAIHDRTLNRTTNGKGRVRKFTLAQLKLLDAGSWFAPKFKGERIPTLREVLQSLNRKTVLIIEVKHGQNKYPQIEQKIVKLIQEYSFEDRVILKSFKTKILDTFEKIAPDIPRLYVLLASWGQLTIDTFLRFRSMVSVSNVSYYQVHKFFINKKLVKQAHLKGAKIIAWGVKAKDKLKMIKLGVDILEVDDPEKF